MVLWADERMSFAGAIEARGGPQGGDGGFAEVSGKQNLSYLGTADLRAPNGSFGTLLLDPADYYVDIVGGPTRPPGASVITNVALQNQLGVGNVVIATDNNANPVGQNGDIFVNAPVTWSAATTLTLSAFRHINLTDLGVPTNLTNTGAGNIILRADSTGTGTGTIQMPGGTQPVRLDWTGSTGTVTVFYNPLLNDYTTPTDFTVGNGRFAARVAKPDHRLHAGEHAVEPRRRRATT